jgi:Tfp pilus assembly protein PilF
MVRRSRGDLPAAGSDLAQVLKVNPTYPEAWIEQGHVHLAAGNREACRDFDRGLSLDPTLDGPQLREARLHAAALRK